MPDIYGKSLFHWRAYDSHPHERGGLWQAGFYGSLLFCLFGVLAVGFAFGEGLSGIVPSIAILTVFGFYIYVNRDGHQEHRVDFMQEGLLVDGVDFFSWESIESYWFAYESDVSVIHFERKGRKSKLSFQMGDLSPDDFRKELNLIGKFEEDVDRLESGLDVWIRTLKL